MMRWFKQRSIQPASTDSLTPRQQRQHDKAQQAYRWCWGLFAFLLLLITLGVVTASVWFGIDTVSAAIASAKPWFAAWRLLTFVVIIGYWPYWVHRLARWADMDPERIEFALSIRWRIALWLVLIEILLAQRVAGDFLKLLVNLSINP